MSEPPKTPRSLLDPRAPHEEPPSQLDRIREAKEIAAAVRAQPEDPRSPRERIMDVARALSLIPDPQQRRRGVLGLLRERLWLGRFGDTTTKPDFLCTVTELIAAAYPDNPNVYWSWIDADQPAVITGIAVELSLAIHAAPEHQFVAPYRRTMVLNPLVRQILFRPGATLRDGLIALAAHPEYGNLVGPELRAILLPGPTSAVKPKTEGPTPEQWMLKHAEDYLTSTRKKLSRDPAVADCIEAIGCGTRAARAAYTKLPKELKISRGNPHG